MGQPLQAQIPIVGEDGRISQYFLRFLRENGIGVETAITAAEDASETAETALAGLADKADKITNLTAGTGLSGGGDLSTDRSFDLDASIDDLNDVDTTTTPPTDAQALIWDDASSLWIPGDVASGGGGGGGGDFVLLDEQTASGASVVDFTALDSAAYESYVIEVSGVTCSNDAAQIRLRVSTDGGSTFDTGSNYTGGGYQSNQATFSSNLNAGANTSYITLVGNVGNAANEGLYGLLVNLFNPAAAIYKGITGHGVAQASDSNVYSTTTGGRWQNIAEYDAVRLYPSAGTFSGKFRLYGRLKVAASGGGGGAVTLIETLSPSAVASVDIESFAGLGYKKIVIDSDLKFSTDGVTATARFKLNGTYKASDYRSAVQQASSSGSTSNSNLAGGTQLYISGTGGTWGVGNSALESYCSSIDILNPDDTVLGKKIIGKGSHGVPSGQQVTCSISGHYEGADFTNALEGIRILASSGTFTGTIHVWGYS